MSSRGPYRRHSAQFKLQLCHDIRSGIAALERKVRQLTMELGFVKKNATPAPREREREFLHHHRPEACSIRPGGRSASRAS